MPVVPTLLQWRDTMVTTIEEDVAYENWGWMLARGVSALLFGFVLLIWPGLSLAALVIFFAALLLVDGITALVYAASGGRTLRGKVWPLIGVGLIGICAAVTTFAWPQITLGVLMVIIAFWAVVRGALELIAAVTFHKRLQGSWFLALSGVLTILFGVILLSWPALGLSMLAWIVGAYAILAGVVFLGLAFRMRNAHQELHPDRYHSPSDQPGDVTPT